ncbi:unnamed protein product [Knipowitschia caucasica]
MPRVGILIDKKNTKDFAWRLQHVSVDKPIQESSGQAGSGSPRLTTNSDRLFFHLLFSPAAHVFRAARPPLTSAALARSWRHTHSTRTWSGTTGSAASSQVKVSASLRGRQQS